MTTDSETGVRKLTAPLGCTELRVAQVVVHSGEVTTPHTHDEQEEVFVATTGGRISGDGGVPDVPADGVVRVAPEVGRNLRKHTDETYVWLAFGVPPVGTVENDGADVVEE